ncbi:MAG: nucleoside triphosphate pyrophosphatase [Chloroflexota bacterium]|nr:nucleoside triphosphate pyrophosphatase [Chloroflexota bacterium]
MALVLASASPRRQELLAAAGTRFVVVEPAFDEATLRHLPPRSQARAAARGKAEAVAGERPGAWVLGSDTVVVVDGEALGKPRDGVEASWMLRRLAGREHEVVSAVCLVAPDGRSAAGYGVSRVALMPLRPHELAEYVATGEPMGKAGAYAIQGLAGEFTALVSGSVDTVIGLPLHVVRRLGRLMGCPELLAPG